MHKQLFIPGPVDVRPDVLEKMTVANCKKASAKKSRKYSKPKTPSSCPPALVPV